MNQMEGLNQSVDAEYNLAVRCHKGGDSGNAEEHFRAVLKRKPNHVQTLLGLGSLLLEQGKKEEADDYMKKATVLIMSPPKLPGETQVGLARMQRNAGGSRRSLLDEHFRSSKRFDTTDLFARTPSASSSS